MLMITAESAGIPAAEFDYAKAIQVCRDNGGELFVPQTSKEFMQMRNIMRESDTIQYIIIFLFKFPQILAMLGHCCPTLKPAKLVQLMITLRILIWLIQMEILFDGRTGKQQEESIEYPPQLHTAAFTTWNHPICMGHIAQMQSNVPYVDMIVISVSII